MIPNDAYWVMENDPAPLLAFAITHGGASERQLRLFVCACLRRVLPTPLVPAESRALASAEQIADDEANVDPDEWTALWNELDTRSRLASSGPLDAGVWLVLAVGENISEEASWLLAGFKDVGISAAIPVRLLREIFGNPFRSIDFAPWRTDTTLALAEGMYAARDFGMMPILADALQDAGCDNDEVLAHCRDATAAHVPGCWVVDGVLGLS